jgi:chromosome segregation ATPase
MSRHDETPDATFIPVEDVADLLGVSKRQAMRYAHRSDVQTQQDGRRILYRRADVERLAKERDAKHDRPIVPHTEVMPPGRLVDLIIQLQQQNAGLNQDVGRLRGLLETQQQLAEDAEQTRRQLAEAEAQAAAARQEASDLRAELERLRSHPWWRRLFSK